MPRTSFYLGVALLVVAATLAITVTLRPAAPAGETSPQRLQDAPSGGRAGKPHSAARPTGANSRSAKSPARPENAAERFTVTAPSDHPQKSLLAEKARKVESEATRQLERMTEQLALTRTQRQRLFPILARSSKEYDPALMISGVAAAPALDTASGHKQVNEVLDPDQKDQLVEDAVADQILWQEIIGKLQSRLDEETPRLPAGETEATESEPVAPRRRGNLFEHP